MRSIAIMNQKGGVGKTTTAVNLAAALADLGKTVCLIDLDPQAHASLHLGLALSDDDPSVYEVLMGKLSLEDVRRRIGENLWIVPSHLDLAASEMELAAEVGREVILRDRIAADVRSFDYLILDCPPSLGVLTINALTAVSEIILPLQPHFLALHGLSKLLHTIEVVQQRLNAALHLQGVVLCMYDSGTRLAAEVSKDVETFFATHATETHCWTNSRTFATRIRRNIRLAEAPSFGQSIFDYDARSHGAEDYCSLAQEVLGSAVPEPARHPSVVSAADVVSAELTLSHPKV